MNQWSEKVIIFSDSIFFVFGNQDVLKFRYLGFIEEKKVNHGDRFD